MQGGDEDFSMGCSIGPQPICKIRWYVTKLAEVVVRSRGTKSHDIQGVMDGEKLLTYIAVNPHPV